MGPIINLGVPWHDTGIIAGAYLKLVVDEQDYAKLIRKIILVSV